MNRTFGTTTLAAAAAVDGTRAPVLLRPSPSPFIRRPRDTRRTIDMHYSTPDNNNRNNAPPGPCVWSPLKGLVNFGPVFRPAENRRRCPSPGQVGWVVKRTLPTGRRERKFQAKSCPQSRTPPPHTQKFVRRYTFRAFFARASVSYFADIRSCFRPPGTRSSSSPPPIIPNHFFIRRRRRPKTNERERAK